MIPVAVFVSDNALEAGLVELVYLPQPGYGPVPGIGRLPARVGLAPDAAAPGIGQADAVHALPANPGGLGCGHGFRFTAALFLDLFFRPEDT